MRSAIDRYTRAYVDAELALPERPYICACCEAPVIVRAGMERAAHFAHRQGRARKDCEQYFPPSVTFTGRPSRPSATHARDDQELSYLCCIDSAEGLKLALCLPPTGVADWSGTIRFEAHDVTRSLQKAQLERGMTIPFSLKDGQWSISLDGEVDDLYLARIELGRRSLELERNLFYATSKGGRAIAQTDTIQLGDSVWWIRKSELAMDPSELPNVEAVLDSHAHGWYAYLVNLPLSANPDELAGLSQWLQRRVRPRRPIVWIDSPWPRAVMADSIVVYCIGDGPLRWLSEQPVDLRVISSKTKEVLIDVAEVMNFTWENPAEGDWEIWINDVHANSVRLTPSPLASGSAILVQLPSGRTLDIAELQGLISIQVSEGTLALPTTLRWRTPQIGKLVHVSGQQQTDGCEEIALELRPGVRIDAQHFGFAEWPLDRRSTPMALTPGIPRSHELARWLVSVGGSRQQKDGLRLHPSSSLQALNPLFRRLAQLSWPRSLAAQVQQLAKELEGLQ